MHQVVEGEEEVEERTCLHLLLRRRVLELTVGSDLSARAVGCHAGLARSLVGTVLQSDDGLTGLQDAVVKLPLVLAGNLRINNMKMKGDYKGNFYISFFTV